MSSPKQDRQGVRTFEQLIRRYNLDGIGEDVVSEMIKQLGQVNEHLALIDTSITQKLNVLLSSNQTWFYGGVPTLENYPVNEWTDTTQKDSHIGDFYYDTDNEKVYIFTKCDGVYEWKSCFSGGCDIDHEALRQEGYDEGFLAGQESVPAGRQTKTGTFTIDTSTGTPTITHNCGFIPSMFVVYPIDEYVSGDLMILGCIMHNVGYFANIEVTKNPNTILENLASSVTWGQASTKPGELAENTATLGYTSGARLWRANFQYGWIAIE